MLHVQRTLNLWLFACDLSQEIISRMQRQKHLRRIKQSKINVGKEINISTEISNSFVKITVQI